MDLPIDTSNLTAQIQAKIASLWLQIERVQELEPEVQNALLAVEGEENVTVTLGFFNEVEISLQFRKRPEDATAVRRRLRQLGYKLKGEMTEWPQSNGVYWYYEGSSWEKRIRVQLSFDEEGAACRFEQVGTEKKPIMKLVCDD